MTWDGVRGTFHWLLFLLLIATIAVIGVGVHWWKAKDAILVKVVADHLKETLPDCEVEFEGVRFVDSSHLELTHLNLRARSTRMDLVHIARVVIALDAELLNRHHRIAIRELMLQSPDLKLIQLADGNWNWSRISVCPPPASVSPDIIIRNGSVRLTFEVAGRQGRQTFVCQGAQATLLADSFRRYDVQGHAVADALGPIHLTGLLDIETGEWSAKGKAGEIRLNDALLEVAGQFLPQVEQQLATLRANNRSLMDRAGGRLERVASADATASPAASTTASLMRADLSIGFQAGQGSGRQPVEYVVEGSIDHGHISDLLLPVPLHDLSAQFRIASDSIQVRDLKAANGDSTLYVDGIARRNTAGWSKEFIVRATQLHLDERIRPFLWGALAETFAMLQPSGSFDVDVRLKQDAGEAPRFALRKFAAQNCRILCDYFRHPVEKISGEVVQRDTAFHVNLTGQAGANEVSVAGVIDPPNVERNIDLMVAVKDVAFDPSMWHSLQRDDQQTLRHALETLRLEGVAEKVNVRIFRGRDTTDRVRIAFQGQLREGQLRYTGFPYEISRLQGKVVYDPLQSESWRFDDLQGEHGSTRITGRGEYRLQDKGELRLDLNVLQAVLDHELEQATVVSAPFLQSIWRDFGIRGAMDVERLTIGWTPGTPCAVTLNGIRWNNGEFTLPSLPYLWKNVSATMEWDGSRLKIHSLHGDHGGTYLLVNGAMDGAAFIHIDPEPEVAWHLSLGERVLHIIKLNPDDEFRRAVPIYIAKALNAVDLRNTVDLTLGLDMKGWKNDPNLVTASWSAFTTLRENSVMTGILLEKVNGNVAHHGSWDGKNLSMEGYLELVSLQALDMKFQRIQGPFLLQRNRLTVGTPKLSGNEPSYHPANPYRQEQLRADLYTGQIGLDADVLLSDDATLPPYQIELSVSDVELGEWARAHNLDSQRLLGKINGTLQATGRGNNALETTGQGWIQITPAALYELPVFAQMLTLLSFRPAQPGDAAFTYAYGDFTIHDGLFDFSKIELVGDALGLVGRGNVGFAGSKNSKLEMDFYSTANNRIPFFGPLVRAVSDRWIRVQVYGTVSQPVARIQQRIPYLNDAFAGFMQAFETGQPLRTPPRPVRSPAARANSDAAPK